MEEIKVSKKAIIRFRVSEMMHKVARAELLRKVARYVKSFNCRMEVIK